MPAPLPAVTDTAPRHGLWIEIPALSIALSGSVVQMRVTKVVGKVPYGDTRWRAQHTATRTVTLQTCVDYNPKGDRFFVQLG